MTRARPVERPAGFTLIELVVVLGIISVLAGMIVFLPPSEKRHADVRASAEELAGTLRAARSLAMHQMAVCGVAFNIRNGKGTSGRVLNNQDGGHWYRIIGPSEVPETGFGQALALTAYYPRPTFSSNNDNLTSTLSGYLGDVEASWIGDRHLLPAKRVRFLALSDQDNGTRVDPSASTATMLPFPATYPRPWFGYWDPTSKRLYPWGGYDTALLDSRGWHCSGFFYEGQDANGGAGIVGCTNPSNRFTTWETSGGRQIFAAGQGRPLINAEWLDYLLVFKPDGTVEEGPTMEARYRSFNKKGPAGGSAAGGLAPNGDLGDLAGGTYRSRAWDTPMTSYFPHTGVFSISLCPDILRDTDTFPTARAALESMSPIYRVTINRFGHVNVNKVSPAQPAGTTFDTSITDWQSKSQIKASYQYLYATDSQGLPRDLPVMGFLTPEVLASRQWWIDVP